MSTYDKILRLTDTLIQQRGFLGFSYADLEKEIGIRKASIHHHFPGKTDLGLAYCEYKTGVFSQLDAALHDIPPGGYNASGRISTRLPAVQRERKCAAFTPCCRTVTSSPLNCRKLSAAWHRRRC
ncbi:TetR/AcrR family transcriptional regulator [Klebsiella pneumoniae]|nr:TetR/AcrR family transcriptional regulator [Klebsiella pneumoniae]